MANLVRTLLVIAVIYYLLKWIARLVGPWLMKKAAQKMQAQAQAQYQTRTDEREEGDVKVEFTRKESAQPNAQQVKKGDDDYIDFVEIVD